MAAVQSGDPGTLAGVLSRQRAHLLKELRSLADARALGTPSAVVSVLITAAELHVRADLGVVDAAEQGLGPGASVGAGASAQRQAQPAADSTAEAAAKSAAG